VSDGVLFDLRAEGQQVRTGWVAPNDGLLAIDRNGDGLINDGSELFGSAFQLGDGSRARDGFQALASLDSNGDGVLTAADEVFASLRVWVDANQDGVSQGAELRDLASLGISSIGVTAQAAAELDHGNWIGLESSYATADGQTFTIADVWFRGADPEDAGDSAPLDAEGAPAPEPVDLAAPTDAVEPSDADVQLTPSDVAVDDLAASPLAVVEPAPGGPDAPLRVLVADDADDWFM